MPVSAFTNDYSGEPLDKVENFHGNQIVHVAWDHHLLFCAPVAFLLPPDAPFSVLLEENIPAAYSQHPEFEKINWDEAEWHLNGEAFEPQRNVGLLDQGVDHKSILRFATPGLNGIKGAGF